MHLVRRGHLYLGLFLFPWAVLYGVTAFLFNHPTAFSEQATTTFGREAVAGTPAEPWPTAGEQAEQVVKLLNAKQSPASPYKLAGDARFNRDAAFATVKADGRQFGILFDVKAGGGTVRETQAEQPKKETERAPSPPGGPPLRANGAAAAGRGPNPATAA